jgi:rhodanese-related sulfurtransferase
MNAIFNYQGKQEGTPIPLSPREAFEYMQADAVIIDIRPEYETSFRVFDVPKVYYLPYNSFRDEFQIIPRDTLLIVADSVGNKSAEAARYLIEQGYPQVAYLAGGVVEWDRAGLPLSKDIDYEMIGGCACKLHPQKVRIEGSAVAPKKEE